METNRGKRKQHIAISSQGKPYATWNPCHLNRPSTVWLRKRDRDPNYIDTYANSPSHQRNRSNRNCSPRSSWHDLVLEQAARFCSGSERRRYDEWSATDNRGPRRWCSAAV